MRLGYINWYLISTILHNKTDSKQLSANFKHFITVFFQIPFYKYQAFACLAKYHKHSTMCVALGTKVRAWLTKRLLKNLHLTNYRFLSYKFTALVVLYKWY